MRVLIVDDEFALLRSLRRLLAGHETYIATDVATAISVAAKYQPDAILLDVLLGDESGIEAVPLLLRVSPGAAIAVMSGDDALKREASSSGAHAWIPKHALPQIGALLSQLIPSLQRSQ